MSTAIISVVLLGLFVAYNLYLKIALTNTEKIQATFLAEEEIEALKAIRDNNWSAISALIPGSTYYISFNGSSWVISASPVAYIDSIFERKFTVQSVLRDSSTKDIGLSGSADADTRRIDATVSWIGRNAATTSVSVSTYITNLHN